MNKNMYFTVLIGLILGATGQIKTMMTMSGSLVTLENKFKTRLVLRFNNPKTNKVEVISLAKDESSAESLEFGDLMGSELFVAASLSNQFAQIEGWSKPITKWYRENYGRANSMIIVFAENRRIDCQFFDPNNAFLGAVTLGHF